MALAASCRACRRAVRVPRASDVLSSNDQSLGGDGSPCLPVLAGTQRATYVTVFEVPPCVTCFAAVRQASMVGKLPTCIGCPPILKISQTTGPIFFSIILTLEVGPHTTFAPWLPVFVRESGYVGAPVRPPRPAGFLRGFCAGSILSTIRSNESDC
jgi:hypothetical protein